jgi:DNA-binding transcriptional regulator YdaS (Cro superfamily)
MNDVELLQSLIDQSYGGNQAAFARAIGRQPAQVNQYLKGRRQLGIEVKLHIEQALHRHGWFSIGGEAAAAGQARV